MAEPATDLMTSILAQTQSQLDQNRETSRVILENQNKANEIITNLVTLYDSVAKDMSTVKAAEQAGKLQVQTAVKSRANAFGVDINANADRMVELATKRTAAAAKADQSLNELHRRSEVKFLDSPLEFIGNQFVGIAEARAAFRKDQGTVARTQAEIVDLNNNIQQTVQTYKALEETVTAASADAATRAAAAQANASALEARLRGIKYDTEAVLGAQQLSQASLNSIYQAHTAQRAEEQLALSKKHFKLSSEQFEFAKEEKELQRNARAELKELDELIVENVNIGRASLGLELLSGVNARQMLALFKTGKQEVYEMYKRGEAAKQLGGRAIIGITPADAIKNLSDNPAAERTLPEAKTPVIILLNQARQQTAAAANAGTLDRKDAKAIETSLNKNAQAILLRQYQQSDSSPDNVFNVGDLKQYLGSDKQGIPAPRAIAGLPLYIKLLKPMAESGIDMSQPKLVYGAVYSALADGKITVEEAVQLSTVYRSVNEINQAAKGLIGFGLVPPNNGKTLNVSLGRFGQIVDITDPVALTRKLVTELTYDKFKVGIPPLNIIDMK